jgi:hypothetical protein
MATTKQLIAFLESLPADYIVKCGYEELVGTVTFMLHDEVLIENCEIVDNVLILRSK